MPRLRWSSLTSYPRPYEPGRIETVNGSSTRKRQALAQASHLHLSMAAAQPSASTFDWKQAIVFLAFLVPLHSRSMLPDAQVVPPPQEILPDCSVLLHSATSAAEPPADSVVRGTTGVAVTAGTTGVSAGTTVGATVVELHSQPNAAAVPATPPPLV